MSGVDDVLLIANPGARQVAAQPELPALLCEALNSHGVKADLLLTKGPGEATELARRGATQGYDAVVVAGGDGTVNEVVNGMAGLNVPLGVVPLGTGNVLGGYIGLRAGEWEHACELVATGVPRRIDLGRLNDRRFAVMAGIGIDAVICGATDSRWKQWVGKLAFVGQCMESVARARPWPSEMEIDGERHVEEIWGVFACNTSHYTWRIRLAPSAQDDDGELDFVILDACPAAELQRILAALFVSGESAEKLPHMRVVRGRELRVSTEREAPWQVDGEVGGETPVHCGVECGALRLICTVPGGRWHGGVAEARSPVLR